MNHAEGLFIKTLDDLSARIVSSDPYEILGASALIRKLLLDDHPLVDQVNRDYRVKITFDIIQPRATPPGLPAPTFWTVQDGLDPDTAPPIGQRVQISRDQFFGTVLSIVQGREFTLREIVLFEANVMGGVHAGTAKKDQEKVLESVGQQISVGGYRSSLRQLKAIGRVVLKALQPLADQVRNEQDV